MKTFFLRGLLSLTIFMIVPAIGQAGWWDDLEESTPQQANGVIFNGAPLNPQQVEMIQTNSQTQLPPGRYWYDNVAGFWGYEGASSVGQWPPNLNLGGPLQANASNGTSGIFLNGRQLPTDEAGPLQAMVGPLVPGNYWLDATLTGGVVGQPPSFNLLQNMNTANQQPMQPGYEDFNLGDLFEDDEQSDYGQFGDFGQYQDYGQGQGGSESTYWDPTLGTNVGTESGAMYDGQAGDWNYNSGNVDSYGAGDGNGNYYIDTGGGGVLCDAGGCDVWGN